MQCRNKWPLEFVKHNLGASFVNGALKEHQTKIITEKSLAKREELMPLAINYRNDQNDKKKIAELKEKISELKKQMIEHIYEIEEHENTIRVRNGQRPHYRDYRRYAGGGAPEPEPKTEKKFVMPCQNSNCNGMLNMDYCCELCDTKTCSKCLEVESEEHECNPDSVESAKLLRNSTKPCPKCGTRISKIDGCDQMWCIECKTAFSWNTGTIETHHIHNPHFFEYMRNNNMEIPRNPQEQPRVGMRCETLRDDAVRFLFRNTTEEKTRISRFIRYVNHIDRTCVRDLNTSIQTKTNNVQPLEIKYLTGELTKEELSEKLMANHRCILKDQAFKDVYSAIVMMADQLCGDIGRGANNINYGEIWKTIVKFTAYFNMELIKALMLHDSKRSVEMFNTESDKTGFSVVYSSKKEMNAELEKLSAVYVGKPAV
jgi:hypothetical protein